MKSSMKITVVVFLIALLAASCSLMGQNTPEPATGTPNATLTALFDLSGNLPATATPPALATATPQSVLPTGQPTLAVPTKVTVPTPLPAKATPTTETRSGTLMRAAYLSTPPKLDGSWSEWRDKTTQYPIKSLVWGAKNWSGEADLEASFGAGWDDKNFYVGFKIYDDKYVQNASGADMYKGDSIELLIDTNLNGDLNVQQLDADDYQLGISCGDAEKGIKPEAYLWYPASKKGTRTQVGIACVFESGLYRVEASIPWSVLGVTPSNGLNLGFVASVNDNDDPSQNAQQTMLSSVSSRVLTDPTTWGWISLSK